MKPSDEQGKTTITKVESALDEGTKALATRQKHIQLGDHSEFGWATVRYYKADPLVSDSDDKKLIKKVEKEAQRRGKKKVAKRRRGTSNAAAKRRRAGWSDQPGPSSR